LLLAGPLIQLKTQYIVIGVGGFAGSILIGKRVGGYPGAGTLSAIWSTLWTISLCHAYSGIPMLNIMSSPSTVVLAGMLGGTPAVLVTTCVVLGSILYLFALELLGFTFPKPYLFLNMRLLQLLAMLFTDVYLAFLYVLMC
jgi:hypothetical protein